MKYKINKSSLMFPILLVFVLSIIILLSDNLQNNAFEYIKTFGLIVVGLYILIIGLYALFGFILGMGLNPLQWSLFFEDLFKSKKDVTKLSRFNLLAKGIIWILLGSLVIFWAINNYI